MTPSTPAARGWVFIFSAFLLAAYALPWLVTPVAALTFNGYDLAEWTSLIPAVRGGTLPLLTTLLLRLPLAAVALLVAWTVPSARQRFEWWLALAVVVVLTIAQLPPLEFFTIARGDPNYQQQFALAAITVVGGFAGLFVPSDGWKRWLTLALAVVAGIGSVMGTAQALKLMGEFRLGAAVGVGAILFVVLVIVFAVAWAFVFRGIKQKE